MAIGQTWFNRIGAMILFLGVAFFVKYAFDQGWLSETTRVVLAAAFGGALVALGEFCLIRGLKKFSGGLLGCGICTLYASAFGAHSFYQLVSHQTASVLYTCVTILSIAVSVHARLLPVALLALIGGYGTPILLKTGVDRQIALLSYVFALNVGFLVCARLRQWDVLRPLAWLATIILFCAWAVEFYDEADRWTTAGFLLAFYLLFHADALFFAKSKSVPLIAQAAGMAHANNTAFFGFEYLVLEDAIPEWLGLFAVVVGGLQWLLGWRICGGGERLHPLRIGLLIDGAAIFALAIPIQFDRHWVTLAWTIQALVVFWFCRSHDFSWLRKKGMLLASAATLHLFAYDRLDDAVTATLFSIGHWTFAWIVLLFAIVGLGGYAGAAMLLLNRRDSSAAADRPLAPVLLGAGTFLLLWIFADQWERYLASWWWLGLAGAWRLVGRRYRGCEWLASALLAAICAKYLAYDTFGAAMDGSWSKLDGMVLNRALITGLLVSGFVAVCRTHLASIAKSMRGDEGEGRYSEVAPLVALIVIAWAATFETVRIFEFEPIRESFHDARLAMHVALSIIWAAYATILVVIGVLRGFRPFRHVAIAIFCLTIFKAIFIDLSQLDLFYRIVSFVVLGILLLLASLMYQRMASNLAKRG